VSQPDLNPNGDILTQLHARDRQFADWLDQLRRGDPIFAEASVLQADGWGEWQAGVYLLTGCHEAWKTLGDQVLEEASIAPVVYELDSPTRGWSSGERTLLGWVAHFWDTDIPEGGYPYRFDEHHFRRWIRACHLYQPLAPNSGITIGGVR